MAQEESHTKEIVGAVGILLAISMAFFLFLRKYGRLCLKPWHGFLWKVMVSPWCDEKKVLKLKHSSVLKISCRRSHPTATLQFVALLFLYIILHVC